MTTDISKFTDEEFHNHFRRMLFDNQGHLPPEYPTDHIHVYRRKPGTNSRLVAVDMDRVGTICWDSYLNEERGGYGMFISGGTAMKGTDFGEEERQEIADYIAYLDAHAPKGPSMEQVRRGEGGPWYIEISLTGDK